MKNLLQIYKKNQNFKNQPNLLLNIDWLTISLDDNFEHLEFDDSNLFQIGDYVLESIDRKTSHFDKFLNVYKNGYQIGEILYSSNHPTILKNRCHFRFKNDVFYSGEIQEIYTDLYNSLNFNNVKISRIDIACDGVYHHKFINSYFKIKANAQLNNYPINRLFDRDNFTPIANNYSENYLCNYQSFTIGSKGNRKQNKSSSERFIRYYNKKLELIQNGGTLNSDNTFSGGNKQYIVDYFKKNSFDLTKDIFRFEIQIRSSWLNTLESFDIIDLFNLKGLTTLFLTSIKNLYDFKFIQNTKKSFFIDMFQGLSEPLWVKVKKVINNKIRTIKIGIKRNLEDVLFGPFRTNKKVKDATLLLVSEQINKYNLSSWWSYKHLEILEEFKKQSKILGIPFNKSSIQLLT